MAQHTRYRPPLFLFPQILPHTVSICDPPLTQQRLGHLACPSVHVSTHLSNDLHICPPTQPTVHPHQAGSSPPPGHPGHHLYICASRHPPPPHKFLSAALPSSPPGNCVSTCPSIQNPCIQPPTYHLKSHPLPTSPDPHSSTLHTLLSGHSGQAVSLWGTDLERM